MKGRVALVTGASGGIGGATAVELARRGARVGVHYFRRKEEADETARLAAEAGGSADVFSGDLTKRAEARRLVADVEARLGPLDVLVNNAGDLIERRPLLEMDEELFRAVIDTNLTSTFFCCQAAVPGMIARKRGTIVNLASLAGWNGGGPGALAYAAAKGAIVSFTKAIAKELAPHGVRANCASPGLIDNTAFHQRFTPRESFEATARTVPLGRAGSPEEVARVIAFLAGDESSYLVGETIEINGGMYMR
jgi:3-oxoacyl-[acyl-carrier protein] reductase